MTNFPSSNLVVRPLRRPGSRSDLWNGSANEVALSRRGPPHCPPPGEGLGLQNAAEHLLLLGLRV
jgi:hypothetical protein